MLVRPFIQPISAFDVANGNGTATVGVLGGDVVETVNYEIYKDTVLVYSSSISVTDNENPNTGLPIDGVRNFAITLTSAMGLMNNNSYTIRVYTQNATLSETSGYSSVQYFSCYVAPSVSLKDSNGVAVENNYEFTSQGGNLYVDFAPNDSNSPVILNSVQISIQGYDGSGYSEIYNSGMVYIPFTIEFDNLTPTENDNSNFTQYKLILTAETVQGMKLSNTYTGLTCAYTITSATDIFAVENNAIEGNIKVSMNLSTINGVAEPTATYTQVSDTKYNLDRTASGSKVTFSNQFNVATPFEIKFWFKPNASGDVIAQFADNGNTYSLTYTLENGTTPTFTLTGGSITAVSGTTANESVYYYVSVVALLGGFSVTVKNAYLATFETDGGEPETNSVYSNEIVQMPTDPEKEGYSFNGWYWYKYFGTESYLALKNAICPSTLDSATIPETTLTEVGMFKGNTKQFNQLVQNGNFVNTSDWSSAGSRGTISANNNELTYTVTTVGASGMQNRVEKTISPSLSGHKLLLTCEVKSTNNTRSFMMSNGGATRTSVTLSTLYQKLSILRTFSLSTLYLGFTDASTGSVDDNFVLRNVQLFDLTTMGLDSITTVDEFTTLYPKSYYDYNAGTLYDSVISGLALTGRNLWDEQWEVGNIDQNTGANIPQDTVIRSKNYTAIIPGVNYYETAPAGKMQLFWYDKDKNYLEYVYAGMTEKQAPSNAYYFRFRMVTSYGTTYNNDICINVSDASFNGQYEPYRLSAISLPSTQTLGGVGTAQDEIVITKNENDDYYTIKKVQRVATEIVDGTNVLVSYKSSSSNNNYLFRLNRSSVYYGSNVKGNIIANTYDTSTWYILYNNFQKGICVNEDKYIWLSLDPSTNANTINLANAWLQNNPFIITYELATPVETVITETATLAEVSAIRENGGMISAEGNTNEDYAQPDVTMDLYTKETVQLPFQMTENTKFFADYTQN